MCYRVGGRLRERFLPPEGYGPGWFYRHVFADNRTQEQALVAAAEGLKDTAYILGYNATSIYGLTDTNITRGWGTMTSDVFYIPERLRVDFIALSMHFVGLSVHTELITAYIMAMLSHGNHSNYAVISGSWVWGDDRNNVSAWGLSRNGLTENRMWVHAVKFSRQAHTVLRWWMELTCH